MSALYLILFKQNLQKIRDGNFVVIASFIELMEKQLMLFTVDEFKNAYKIHDAGSEQNALTLVDKDEFDKAPLERMIQRHVVKRTDEERIWKFVFQTAQGFQSINRNIACPSIEEIEPNYTDLDPLQQLIATKRPYETGKYR